MAVTVAVAVAVAVAVENHATSRNHRLRSSLFKSRQPSGNSIQTAASHFHAVQRFKRALDAVRNPIEPFIEDRPTIVSEIQSELIHSKTAMRTADWRDEEDQGNVLAPRTSVEFTIQKEDGS
ncbi:MAG: hypothetical protein ABJZ55_06890 [Fuerstiella sp.]